MWRFKNKDLTLEDIPEKSIGFLYKITRIADNKVYYGRKMLTAASTKTLKGVKKKVRKSSGWESYWGSNRVLLDDIAELGEDKFTKEILIFCDTKACLTVGEESMLHITGSMFDPNCYNSNIRARIFQKWFTKTPNFHNDLMDALK